MSDESVRDLFERERRSADLDEQDEVYVAFRRESLERLLDAAIAVVTATKDLATTAEELLREQRTRLGPGEERSARRTAEQQPRRRRKITVRDGAETREGGS